jgi:hypothetical protein
MPRNRRGPRQNAQHGRRSRETVFLNVPYDAPFQRLFLAYIAALTCLGFAPRVTLGIPLSKRRLDRILKLIASCDYSVHDLSRVQLDRKAPRTPRFNMPFELGLAVAVARQRGRDNWLVCETRAFRVQKSLSDLNGTDIFVHDGTVAGVFREMCQAFARRRQQPTVAQMWKVYGVLRAGLKQILQDAGARDVYSARVFRDISVVAARAAERVVK